MAERNNQKNPDPLIKVKNNNLKVSRQNKKLTRL